MTCVVTSSPAIDLSQFAVDTTAFDPGGTWWVTNILNSLYLATTGAVPVTASYQWNPIKTGNWDTAVNWQGGVAPPMNGHATNTLEFGGSGVQSYTATNNLGIDHLLSNLLLTSTSTGTNILAGQQLKFAGAGSGILLQGSGWTISSNRMNWTEPLLLGGSGVGGGMILTSNLVGTGAVTVASGGTYVMAGSNAFRGDLLVNCSGLGKLLISNADALGSNSVVVSNGTLQISSTAFNLGGVNQPNLSGLVTGSGSIWTNTAIFKLGTNSGFNTLTIANAGRMYNGAVVAIGDNGSSNTAVVKDGGLWNLKGSTLTIGKGFATGNVVRLDGTGGVITNAPLEVGTLAGRDNKLVVTNNGTVYSTASTIGVRSTNNTVLVGGGGTWNLGGVGLTIGDGQGSGATGNVLRVDDGGVVTNINPLYVGYWANSQLNGLVITNGGRVHVVNGTSAHQIGYSDASNNYIIIEGSNSVGPATLSGNGADTRFYVGGPGAGWGSWVRVGSGGLISLPANAGGLRAGFNIGNNYIIITNGGQVITGNSTTPSFNNCVGYQSSNNYAIVTGNNGIQPSTWNGGGAIFDIGNAGTGNWMRVEDGGLVTNVGVMTVGTGAPGSGNSLTLTNGGRAYVTGLTLAAAAGNRLNGVGVYDGGMLSGSNYPISIGIAAAGTGSNSLTVGVGGTVTNAGTLQVGNTTSSNQLYLSGGSLSVSNLVCSSVNNTITFSAGTLNLRGAYISNTVPFVVGDGAQGATLNLVAGRGTNIFAQGLTITNKATLTGAGMIWGTNTVYGTNSPGVSGIGVITNVGNVTLAAGAVSRFEIAANTTGGNGWDLLVVTNGTLTVGGTLRPILTGGFIPTDVMSFVIMTNFTATVSGTFANQESGKVNVYTNDSLTSLVGAFNVGVSNSQYVVLNNFKPPLASGTVFKLR
jgi:hypothetical protein